MARGIDNKDRILAHFKACLTSTPRADGNPQPVFAKGDCSIMLELIRMKLQNIEEIIDRVNPGRFRGLKALTEDYQKEFGNEAVIHLPKWGASHFRGGLRDDERRGNKRHLIAFIDKLNDYNGGLAALTAVYRQCLRLHHEYWNSFSLTVNVQKSSRFQQYLTKILSTASFGRVQQGLVFASLRRKYGRGRDIVTKKTFAGDHQSSRKGTVMRGDIQVTFGGVLALAVEVKDAEVNETVWKRVAATHGSHDYALFVLGTRFAPSAIQFAISSRDNTYALHLFDFIATLVFDVAMEGGCDPKQVLLQIVDIYNCEFCESIEQDRSMRISIVENETPTAGV